MRTLAWLLVAALSTGCSASPERAAPAVSTSSTSGDSPAAEETGPEETGPEAAAPGTVPPPWLGTRLLPVTDTGYAAPRRTPAALRERRFTLPDTVPMLPGRGFAARVAGPAPDDVVARSSWAPGCPVGRDDLAWLRLAFRGFDGARHTGELLVNAAVADDVVAVFRRLYEEHFPLEQLVIAGPYEPGGPTTGDGNATGCFVCRPVTGGSSYSQHAYGLAIDVNTFQNPYQRGLVVLPELATAYLDRDWVRPGMIFHGGPVVDAFAAVGWEWGGDWSTLKDYQHFSVNGR